MSKRTPKKILPLAQAVPQKALPPTSISVEELVAKRDNFRMPNYQREKVWNLRQNQQFVDSLLLGDPFSPLEGYEKFMHEGEQIGVKYYEIGDGQNRLAAIIGFVRGEFKTWTESQKMAFEPTSQLGPVEPGKFFEELSPIVKNYLLGYHVRIDLLHERPESEKMARFLRVQTHVSLSKAEKLNAFLSKAKNAAKRIEQHSFWEDFYDGRKNRKQLFQNSLYLLALEMSPSGIQDLQAKGFIYGLISGWYDDDISEALVEAVLARLDVVSCVYAGTSFTIRSTSILMYQSVMFLEQAGYVVVPTDEGRLTSWVNGIIADSKRSSGTPSYNRPIQLLTGAKAQREFWDRHRKTIMVLFGTLRHMTLEGGAQLKWAKNWE